MTNQQTPITRMIHGFSASGLVQFSTRSTKPPEKPKPMRTGSSWLIAIEMPMNSACSTYRNGARNMNENSSGSVTPTKNDATAPDSRMP